MTKPEGSLPIDRHHSDYLIASVENRPPPRFLALLREMQEAGMVGAVDQSRYVYKSWFEGLEGSEAVEADNIFVHLEASRAIEREHGFGAALDLNHRHVQKLIEWDQLGPERHQNAIRYREFAASR
jgi:hypothetical protein